MDHVVPSADLSARIAGIAERLQEMGYGAVQATRGVGQIYGQVIRQAQTLAYLDVLFLLAIFTAIMVPAVLMTLRTKPAAAAMAH